MSTPQKLLFDETEIATPTAFKIEKEKVMSDNAGLSSRCSFVGDVKGIITTIHIEWQQLTPTEVATINSFVLDPSNLFFPVTYLNEEFEEVTQDFRADGPTYEQWGWDVHRQLCRVLALDIYNYQGVGDV